MAINCIMWQYSMKNIENYFKRNKINAVLVANTIMSHQDFYVSNAKDLQKVNRFIKNKVPAYHTSNVFLNLGIINGFSIITKNEIITSKDKIKWGKLHRIIKKFKGQK